MINWIRSLFSEGISLPLAFDPATKLPSVTLLFFYISYVISTTITTTSSVYLLLQEDYLTATYMPALSVITAFVCYRLRYLDKIRIDLDDRAIELESNHEGKLT